MQARAFKFLWVLLSVSSTTDDELGDRALNRVPMADIVGFLA